MSKRKYKEKIWPKLEGSKKERKRRKKIRQSLRERKIEEENLKKEKARKRRGKGNCTKTDARKRIEKIKAKERIILKELGKLSP